MAQQVIALKDGFYRGNRIREGTEFTFRGEKLGKWMQPVGKNTGSVATPTEAKELSYNEMLASAKEKGLTFDTKPKKEELKAALDAFNGAVEEGESPLDLSLAGEGVEDETLA